VNVGLLIITHGNVGSVLLRSAVDVLDVCPMPTATLSAPTDCEPDAVLADACDAAEQLDRGDGVLVLTDMFGATPCNIACRLRETHDVRVVSGVNLPMLIRVLNYPDLDLDELMHKAVTGGRDGVLVCSVETVSRA
jgi:PTS system ascorbate-specific IIA component